MDFVNPTNGAKSLGVKVTYGASTILLNECHDASGQSGVQRNLVTAQFTACDISQLTVEVASYTGNSTCLGIPCTKKLSIAGAPLPVYFRSFTASRSNSNVELIWVTSFEQNSLGFEIQRQAGNGKWQTISFVNSKANSGNSIADITYSYTDTNNVPGISNYRFAQVDMDGKFKFSEIRTVQGNNYNAGRVTLYPNPATNGNVTVVFKDAATIYDVSLMDANGRILRQWNNTKGKSLNITNMIPGFYNLHIVSRENGKLTVEKLIVAH